MDELEQGRMRKAMKTERWAARIRLPGFVLFLLLAGCGGKDSSIGHLDGPPAPGDMLVEATIGDAKNLNPPLISETTGSGIASLVFGGLIRPGPDLEPEGEIAESWEVSSDGRVLTYHLRRGVRFHDGHELTGEDVAFTAGVYADPEVNSPHRSDYEDIERVEVLSPHRVRVTYRKPFAPALWNFGAILPRHVLQGQDVNKAPFNRAPLGSGPYRFVEWKTDRHILLEANSDYWEGAPYVSRYLLRIIPDQSTAFLELLNGGVDALGAWAGGALTPEQYARQTGTPGFRRNFEKYRTSSLGYTYLGWNLNRPMFRDKRVRRALTLALDRRAIVDNVLYGLGEVATGPYPPASWAHNPDVEPLPYDPEAAKKLLAEAGWTDTDGDQLLDRDLDGDGKREPFSFEIVTNQGNVSRERVATIVQRQLQEVGVEARVRILEWTTFLTQFINKRDYDATILGWSLGVDPDAYAIWHSSKTGEHEYNFVGYANPKVDRLLEEGRRTLDLEARKRIYRQIHAILAEDLPYTFLYVPAGLSAVHRRFKGIEVTEWSIGRHPERWYVPAALQKHTLAP